MALPVVIPNTFANANASIPLSQLDNNFSTVAVAINGMANGAEALSNVNITGGSIANASLSNVSISSGNVTINVANVTTLDATNVEVTNINAKDGTASATIANSTGVMTIGSSVLTTADINGGTIDGTSIGGSTPAAGAFTTLSATGNVTLGDASTDTVTVNGYMGIGAAASTDSKLYIVGPAASGTNQYGVQVRASGTSGATGSVRAVYGRADTEAASFTTSAAVSFWSADAIKGAGSTITNQHGVYISDQTQGTNNYGITSLVSSGANKYNIYASGTAQNYFAGNVGIGVASPYKTLHVRSAASGATSTTSLAHLVVESSGDTGLNILTPNTSSGYITFGDPENGSVGRIQYEHTANYMAMFTNNSERMRLDSSGNLGIGTTSAITKLDVNGTSLFRDTQYGYQPAPTATVTAPATLTAAQLLTQIIPIDGGAQNITMPTGSALDSGLPSSFPTNGAFDFTIINTDSGAQSLLVNTGVTIVGSAVIGLNESSIFRLRKTGTATYVVYRLA